MSDREWVIALRRTSGPKRQGTQLQIPAEIGRALAARGLNAVRLTIHDEGLLLVPVRLDDPRPGRPALPEVDLPDGWGEQ